jgi:hypothetical protein
VAVVVGGAMCSRWCAICAVSLLVRRRGEVKHPTTLLLLGLSATTLLVRAVSDKLLLLDGLATNRSSLYRNRLFLPDVWRWLLLLNAPPPGVSAECSRPSQAKPNC